VRGGEANEDGGCGGEAAAWACDAAARLSQGGEVRRRFPSITACEDGDKRRRWIPHLQAQNLDGFATTRQWRRRGIDGGGGGSGAWKLGD
jgi:hypothetical protein